MSGIEELLSPFPRKKTRRRKIPKAVKNAVWAKYIGMDKTEGRCHACKRPIHITTFEVGHNIAVSKGGSDDISNLRPICGSCNRSMGNMSIEDYKRRYFSKKSKKRKTTRRRKTRRRKTPLEELLGVS